MPIGRVNMCESPTCSGPRQAIRHVRISVDINIVVEIDEAVMDRLTERNPDQKREDDANADHQPALIRTDCLVFRFMIHRRLDTRSRESHPRISWMASRVEKWQRGRPALISLVLSAQSGQVARSVK